LVVVIDVLWPAQRNAEVNRLECWRVAAPAAIGFLESERLLNPQFAPSLITHDGFGWLGLSLQHMPVQLDAIGLQTAN
jgi:hypothetical protein